MDTLSKERMHDWAEELKEMYNSADSNFELMDCADAMADFIEEFLKIKWQFGTEVAYKENINQ